jgi:hypothetical protein
LVNNRNLVFSVERRARGANDDWYVQRIKVKVNRTPVSAKENWVVASMPDEDTIHLFWVDSGKWFLMTV